MTREEELRLIDDAIASGRCKVITWEEALRQNEEMNEKWHTTHARRFNNWDKGDRGGSATSRRFRERRLKNEGIL